MLLIASRKFDTESFIRVLQSHVITQVATSPAMMHSVLSYPELELHRMHPVKSLILGAEMVSPSLLKECRQKLNPEKITAAWGMTAGIGVLTTGPEGSIFLPNGTPSVGKILPGARLRICKPGTRNPVKRGQEGEIHYGGTSVIKEYLGNSVQESFYTDEHGIWLVTGDQGLMDDEENVYILGRFKDIIIRGGENISPAMIERCLDGHPITKVILNAQDEIRLSDCCIVSSRRPSRSGHG